MAIPARFPAAIIRLPVRKSVQEAGFFYIRILKIP
jgi:hypothetical protein